ncbi:MAG: hypothetical protein ACOX7J_05850 [Bacillota bacterium]|jgi:hypothetical protein
MSSDKNLKSAMRNTILDYIKHRVESGEYKPLQPEMVGLPINETKNEIVKDSVIYEGEDGIIVQKLRENSYSVPEVDVAWIDSEWWVGNKGLTLEEATIAVAYDYLLQEKMVVRQDFADESKAARFIYDTMNDIRPKDDFVQRAMTLLRDFYSDISENEDD